MHFDYNLTDEKGHSASAVGTSRFVSGKFSYAAGFDGSWYVHLDNAGFGNIINSGYWTIEFWLYPTSSNTNTMQYILSSWYQNQWQFMIRMDERNKLTFECRGGYGDGGRRASVNIGAWNHVALVRNGVGNNVRFYVNGTYYDNTDPETGNSAPTTNQLDIAYKNDTGTYASYFNIDELRISKIARYTSSFTPPSSPFSS